MSVVLATCELDASSLERTIPMIAAFGTRTVQQQCVTSAAFICFRAQDLTRAADIGRMDSELEVTVTPKLSTRGKRKGLPLMSGKKNVAVPDQSVAMMIAISRLHPNSKYSISTGNRWPVAMPNTEGRAAFFDFMAKVAARMVSARHSSANYLQHGWQPAISKAISNPLYRYFRGGPSRAEMKSNPNPLNTMDHNQLGGITINLAADGCVVTAENNVGDNGKSSVLNEKHRNALVRYGAPALQQAIDEETSAMLAEIQRRWDAGKRPIEAMLN